MNISISDVFQGNVSKLQITSNNIGYGPCPEPYILKVFLLLQ